MHRAGREASGSPDNSILAIASGQAAATNQTLPLLQKQEEGSPNLQLEKQSFLPGSDHDPHEQADSSKLQAPPVQFRSTLFKKGLLAASKNQGKSRYAAYSKANARKIAKSIRTEGQRDNFVLRKSAGKEILAGSGTSSQEHLPLDGQVRMESRTILAQSVDLPDDR